MPKLVFELDKLHSRLMTLVCQSWEMSLPHLNREETPFVALPLSQLTLSEIRLTLGLHLRALRVHVILCHDQGRTTPGPIYHKYTLVTNVSYLHWSTAQSRRRFV
jgi:hypothetical protein